MNAASSTSLDQHDAIRAILRGEHEHFGKPQFEAHVDLPVYLRGRNLSLARDYECDPLPDIEIQQILDPRGAPILPIDTLAGLRDALTLARWESPSWNDISSGWVEWKRLGDPDDTWTRDCRELRAVIMTEASEYARCKDGIHVRPWAIRGQRAEDRRVLALAQRNTRRGQPDEDYTRVDAWIHEFGFNQRLGLTELLEAAGVLHRYEGRAPREVQQAGRKCLQANGWTWKPARRPGRSCPCLSWCSPDV